MSTEAFLPPLRDLPPGRLEQRERHLRAETAVPAWHRHARGLAIAAAGVAILAILFATPAFGLRDRVVHLFVTQGPPPELVQRYFANMNRNPPGRSPGVLPRKARVAVRLSVDGFGHKVLWVAPTRAGGYCTAFLGSCNPDRSRPFLTTWEVAGPNSQTSPGPGSRDVHVFIEGDTPLPGAARVGIHFEDGDSVSVPLVRVPKPIDAGFFVYELTKDHWDAGHRLVSLSVQTADGMELARDTKVGGSLRVGLNHVLAPPSVGVQHGPTATFTDPAGDAGHALDITKVDVSDDEHGYIDFEITVVGTVDLEVDPPHDQPLIALDLDQNPDTGSAFYGTEVQIVSAGGLEVTQYRAHGWDFRSTKGIASGAGTSGPHTVDFRIKRSALGLKPKQGFNFVVGSASAHPDMAPNFGTFDYEPVAGTKPPALGPDRRAPKVLAFDSTGVHGKTAKIGYWVLDGRGRTGQVIRIFRGRRLLKTIWTPLADANPFDVSATPWQVPEGVHGTLRFTVRSIDTAGNESKLSSAELVVR